MLLFAASMRGGPDGENHTVYRKIPVSTSARCLQQTLMKPQGHTHNVNINQCSVMQSTQVCHCLYSINITP